MVWDLDELVLFTNKKSQMGFRPVPQSVTLNGPVVFITCYFTQYGSFWSVKFTHIVNDKNVLQGVGLSLIT